MFLKESEHHCCDVISFTVQNNSSISFEVIELKSSGTCAEVKIDLVIESSQGLLPI